MTTRRLLLLSNSKLYGQDFFEWCPEITKFFEESSARNILFIPYATRDYDKYESVFKPAFEKLNLCLESIHRKEDPVKAVNECKAIFVGGGNTFLLLKTLYDNNLIEPIRNVVFNKNVPYMGSSAGTNVATCSISTTNDMPICYPPSFEALKLVPFNINPHYIDADVNSKHQGETREDRIKEYLKEPISAPVLALREGCGLLVEDMKASLFGLSGAILFQKDKEPVSYENGSDLSFLLDVKCT